MSQELEPYEESQRRRRDVSRVEGDLAPVDAGTDLVSAEQQARDIGRAETKIQAGASFRNPADEFPAWAGAGGILETVRQEYISRTGEDGTVDRGEQLKRPDQFFALVSEVVSAHPEWQVQPVLQDRLATLLRAYIFGYGALQDMMTIDGLEDIYFNRFDQGYYIQSGVKHRITDRIFADEDEMMNFIIRVANENGLEINLQRPNLDATLQDGSRLNATLSPLAYDGPDFVIRKHAERAFTIDDYIASGMVTKDLATDIQRWVMMGMNIVVSGGTSSGKTTFLNTIGNTFIPPDDRLLVLENRKELQIRTADTKYFQTREDATRENSENDITMWDLIRFCLRKRPDRIIVGEVRGREAYHALVAWNSGHDGSMCTIHANSAPGALSKLEQLAASAGDFDQTSLRGLISDAVDIVIQVERAKGHEQRRVTEVVQVLNRHKFDSFDPEMVKMVEELRESGRLLALRDELWVLPLYRKDAQGQLTKVNNMIPVLGKSTS